MPDLAGLWAGGRAFRDRAPEQGGSGEEIPPHFSCFLLAKPEASQRGCSQWHLPQGQLLGLRIHGGESNGKNLAQ